VGDALEPVGDWLEIVIDAGQTSRLVLGVSLEGETGGFFGVTFILWGRPRR
jgi:hypothetical protein